MPVSVEDELKAVIEIGDRFVTIALSSEGSNGQDDDDDDDNLNDDDDVFDTSGGGSERTRGVSMYLTGLSCALIFRFFTFINFEAQV